MSSRTRKNSNFAKQLSVGNTGEEMISELLCRNGLVCTKHEGSSCDLWVTIRNKEYLVEVKHDVKSALTNNLAIEYYNSRQNKPSGIYGTDAVFWFQIIKGKFGGIYVTTLTKLRDFVKRNVAKKAVRNSGDGNADLLIYDAESILQSCFEQLSDKVNIEEVLFELLIKSEYPNCRKSEDSS